MSVFLISKQLPPPVASLRMFRDLISLNEDTLGAITVITTKKQTEILKLTAISLSSTASRGKSLCLFSVSGKLS